MFKLRVTPAEGDTFVLDVEADALVIGRSTKCDVSIPDRFLSRRHARLFKDGDRWLVEDLGSRNGTFVNGTKIERPEPVRTGDVLAMSASLVRLFGEGLEEATSTDVFFKPVSDVLQKTTTPPPAGDSENGRALALYADRLAIVNEVHQALAGSLAIEELLDLILDRAFEHLRPEHGAIFLRRDDGGFEKAVGRSLEGAEGELVYSESLVDEVANKEVAALVVDAQTDHRFAAAESMLSAGVRALIAAPLLDPNGALGYIMLSSNAAVRQFTEDDLDLLVTLASVAAMRVRNVALGEEAAERRRLEWELKQARQIQVSLFPYQLPQIAGYDLYAGNIPSRGVSGDYYEVTTRDRAGDCALLVADVAGKGMSASIITGYLEALTSIPIEAGLEPHEVFEQASFPFFRRTPDNRFATILLAVVDPPTGRLRYANAGHNPGLLIRQAGEVELLGATGLPLGLIPDADYTSRETSLDPGDVLVLYSDGYTEAEGPDDEEFGIDRLTAACASRREDPLNMIAKGIESELETFAAGRSFRDDRTLVMLRRVE